jgi:hypothetical protein
MIIINAITKIVLDLSRFVFDHDDDDDDCCNSN